MQQQIQRRKLYEELGQLCTTYLQMNEMELKEKMLQANLKHQDHEQLKIKIMEFIKYSEIGENKVEIQNKLEETINTQMAEAEVLALKQFNQEQKVNNKRSSIQRNSLDLHRTKEEKLSKLIKSQNQQPEQQQRNNQLEKDMEFIYQQSFQSLVTQQEEIVTKINQLQQVNQNQKLNIPIPHEQNQDPLRQLDYDTSQQDSRNYQDQENINVPKVNPEPALDSQKMMEEKEPLSYGKQQEKQKKKLPQPFPKNELLSRLLKLNQKGSETDEEMNDNECNTTCILNNELNKEENGIDTEQELEKNTHDLKLVITSNEQPLEDQNVNNKSKSQQIVYQILNQLILQIHNQQISQTSNQQTSLTPNQITIKEQNNQQDFKSQSFQQITQINEKDQNNNRSEQPVVQNKSQQVHQTSEKNNEIVQLNDKQKEINDIDIQKISSAVKKEFEEQQQLSFLEMKSLEFKSFPQLYNVSIFKSIKQDDVPQHHNNNDIQTQIYLSKTQQQNFKSELYSYNSSQISNEQKSQINPSSCEIKNYNSDETRQNSQIIVKPAEKRQNSQILGKSDEEQQRQQNLCKWNEESHIQQMLDKQYEIKTPNFEQAKVDCQITDVQSSKSQDVKSKAEIKHKLIGYIKRNKTYRNLRELIIYSKVNIGIFNQKNHMKMNKKFNQQNLQDVPDSKSSNQILDEYQKKEELNPTDNEMNSFNYDEENQKLQILDKSDKIKNVNLVGQQNFQIELVQDSQSFCDKQDANITFKLINLIQENMYAINYQEKMIYSFFKFNPLTSINIETINKQNKKWMVQVKNYDSNKSHQTNNLQSLGYEDYSIYINLQPEDDVDKLDLENRQTSLQNQEILTESDIEKLLLEKCKTNQANPEFLIDKIGTTFLDNPFVQIIQNASSEELLLIGKWLKFLLPIAKMYLSKQRK